MVSITRVAIILGQLGYVKLYSNYLTAYELGVFFFLVTASYSLNAFIFIPMDYYQQSKIYHFLGNGKSLNTFFIFNRKFILRVFLLILLVALIFIPLQATYALFTILAGTMSLSLYVTQALRGVLNNLEHRRVVAASMVFESFLKISFFWFFLQFMQAKAITLLFSGVVSLVFVALFLLKYAYSLNIFTSETEITTSIRYTDVFRFGLPISVGAVFNWIQLQGYRLVLVPLGFAETVGIYATVSNIGSAGMVAASSIYAQLYVPNIYKSGGQYTKTYIRNAFILIVFLFFSSMFFCDFIVSLLTKAEFVKYSWLLLFGIIAEAGNFLLGALSIHLTLTNSTSKLLTASMVGTLTMIIVFVLIYFYGAVTVQTIGLPIVISQVAIVIYMYNNFRICKGN